MFKKSRILTFTVILALLASLLAVSAFAEGDGALSVTASDIVDGKFTATVSISGNPGISGMSLRLGFDSKKMTPVSFDASNGICPEAMSNVTQENADLSALDEVSYFFAVTDDIATDGILFNVTFSISADAAGVGDLVLSYASGGVTNSAYGTLTPDISNCTVDISSAMYPGGVITLESEYLGLDFYRVSVGLYGNPGIAALRFTLKLSESVVVRSVDFTGLFDGVTSNTTQPGVDLSTLASISYNYTAIENNTDTGELFSFTLRLVDGFGRITVEYGEGDIVNSDLEILSPHKSTLTFGTLDIATVSFDGNTDLPLSGDIPAAVTYVKNACITLPFCPEREDKAYFLGWSEDKNATSATYQPQDKFLVTKDTTLYAVWTVRTYTVSYDANGGTGAPSAQTKIHGFDVTLSRDVPTRANYDFAGWSVLSDGTAVDYAAGDVYSENISVTLYAVWKPHRYSVSFNANGGEDAPAPIVKIHGIDTTLPTAVPVKSGLGFAGWSDSSSGNAKYLPGDKYTANGDTVLYAVWTSDKYDVAFDANGGTNAPAPVSMASSLTLTLPLNIPEKEGFSFLGWAESKSAAAPDYKIGDIYSKKTSVTLYAVWETAKYTVTFDTNGGEGSFAPVTFSFGGSATIPSTIPAKTGADFLGWAESADATEAAYAPGGSFSYNRSATLYAVWSPHKYKITFNANGGTNAPASQEKLHGTDLRLSAVKPLKEGYTFLGWAESANALEPAYKAGGLYTSDKGTTLYAVWKVTTYTVTYNLNGGTGSAVTGTKIHGTPLIITSFQPTKSGYTFLGWAYTPDALSPNFVAGNTYTEDAQVTLYAVWTVKRYIVAYDANGGAIAPGAQYKIHDVPLTIVNIKPAREDYVFLGWALTSEEQTVAYQPGDTYSDNAELTLYAVWCEAASAAEITLSVTSGGGKLRVDVNLALNPGIAALSFRLNFDSTKVKLIEIAANEDDEPEGVLSGATLNFDVTSIPDGISYIDFGWYSGSNKKTTGVILSATFELLCDVGEETEFSVSLLKNTSNAGGKVVPTGVDRVCFTIPDFMPGDLNDDGKINATDAVMLAQYLASWAVDMNINAADCNGDGTINAKDSVLLAQYLANWDVTLG